MIVPEGKHTKLIPLWKIAGYSLGFFPNQFGGTKALYITIESVEIFVEHFVEEPLLKSKLFSWKKVILKTKNRPLIVLDC